MCLSFISSLYFLLLPSGNCLFFFFLQNLPLCSSWEQFYFISNFKFHPLHSSCWPWQRAERRGCSSYLFFCSMRSWLDPNGMNLLLEVKDSDFSAHAGQKDKALFFHLFLDSSKSFWECKVFFIPFNLYKCCPLKCLWEQGSLEDTKLLSQSSI